MTAQCASAWGASGQPLGHVAVPSSPTCVAGLAGTAGAGGVAQPSRDVRCPRWVMSGLWWYPETGRGWRRGMGGYLRCCAPLAAKHTHTHPHPSSPVPGDWQQMGELSRLLEGRVHGRRGARRPGPQAVSSQWWRRHARQLWQFDDVAWPRRAQQHCRTRRGCIPRSPHLPDCLLAMPTLHEMGGGIGTAAAGWC